MNHPRPRAAIGERLTRDNIGWNDPPNYDPRLGRLRTASDDFFDHRRDVLERIQTSMDRERIKLKRRG